VAEACPVGPGTSRPRTTQLCKRANTPFHAAGTCSGAGDGGWGGGWTPPVCSCAHGFTVPKPTQQLTPLYLHHPKGAEGGPPSHLSTVEPNPSFPQDQKLPLSMWVEKKFFTARLVRPWHRLPREAVAAPSLAVFKARLDGALSNLG